jgi:uncharacterized protein involved in exopolysaccharide biosynthesis
MMALIASQLLGFILGGGVFLLRYDRREHASHV